MKKNNIKKEMLYSLLVPYILLGIMASLTFIYMYKTSINNIRNEATLNSYSILSKMNKEIDYLIQDIQRLVIEVGGNSKILKLLSTNSSEKSNTEHYQIAMAAIELKKIKKYNSLIQDINIYYHKGEFCINSFGMRPINILYDDFYHNNEIDYNEWVNLITATYNKEHIMNLDGQLIYIITVPYNEEVDKINLIIQIERNHFNDLITSYSNLNEGFLYILDSELNTVASNKALNILTDELLENLDFETEKVYKKININNENYTAICIKSNELDLKYIWLIENRLLLKKSNYILISFSCLLVIFIILLFIGVYGVKTNYKKIEAIIKKLKDFEYIPNEKTSDVTYINNTLNTIQKNIEYQKNLMVESIIRKAIYGLVEEDDESYNYLLKTNEMLCTEESFIAIFEISQDVEIKAKDLKLNMFVVENIIRDLFTKGVNFTVLTIQTWQVVIVTYKTEEFDDCLDYVLDTLERARKLLANQLELNYTVGVSSPVIGINEFRIAYKEAIEAIQEKVVVGNNKLIYYGNLENHNNQYIFDKSIQNQLLNYIKIGEIDKVKSLISNLFDINFKQNQISTECGKLFILDLLETISQVTTTDYSINIEPSDILKENYTIYDIQAKIFTDIDKLCENNHLKDRGGGKKEKILNYIHENYKDSNLNVGMIADYFNLNPSYLSRFFKEQTGENLLTYINYYRVEKVKSLLETTDKTLISIAEETGFINSSALNRAFKKYEGITPGQYKAIYKNK